MKRFRPIHFSKKFKYKSRQNEYVFQLKRKRRLWPWLLLLGLIAAVVLIPRCVRCCDCKNEPCVVGPLVFRTIVADTDILLPHCDLTITDSDGKIYLPSESGNGEFVIDNLPDDAVLTITSEKDGFQTNDYSVNHVRAGNLRRGSQSGRDIPMKPQMMPCDAGVTIDRARVGDHHTRTYDLGRKSGTTTISLDFNSKADTITVYDGPNISCPVILPATTFTYRNIVPITFSNGCITVVMSGSSPMWNYTVQCP